MNRMINGIGIPSTQSRIGMVLSFQSISSVSPTSIATKCWNSRKVPGRKLIRAGTAFCLWRSLSAVSQTEDFMNTKILAGLTIAAALSLPLAANAQNGAAAGATTGAVTGAVVG